MKKIVSILLAAVMCIGLSVSAFAADETVSSIEGNHYTITFDREVEVKTETLAEFQYARGETAATEVTVYQIPVGTKITVSSSKDGMVYMRSDLTGALGVLQMDGIWDNKGSFFYSAKNTFANGSTVSYKEVMPKKFSCYEYVVKDSTVLETSVPIRVRVIGESTASPAAPPAASPAQPAQPETTTPNATEAAKAPAAAPAAAPAPTHSGSDMIHTVKMGDTFGNIALNYYGDMSCWPVIYNYNAKAINAAKNKQIFVGMELAIPSEVKHGEKTLTIIAPCVVEAGEKLYTVKSGDTYGTIAAAHFGNMSRYQELFDRNSDRLANINTLYEGQILVLPKK